MGHIIWHKFPDIYFKEIFINTLKSDGTYMVHKKPIVASTPVFGLLILYIAGAGITCQ